MEIRMHHRFWLASLATAACLSASAAAAQSQAEMNDSAAQNLQKADQALNAQYSATMNSLSPESRGLLRNAQRAWITFRDRQCRYEASAVSGGSAYPMIQSMCLEGLTITRTEELHRLGHCEEGDLSCPH